MANSNEIKRRITGVRSTRQVTHAMYLISASKSKRAKSQLEAVKPFFDAVETALAEILTTHGPAAESAFIRRPVSGSSPADGHNPAVGHTPAPGGRALCFAIGGDKGMAGGYNHNLMKFLADNIDKDRTTVLMAGFLGRSRAVREGFTVDRDFRFPVMNPNLPRARDIADILIERFLSGEFCEVSVVYTRMVTALKQEPVLLPLLPLSPAYFSGTLGGDTGKYNTFHFEPDPAGVFASLMPHYVKGVVYAALVDAYSSEQNARMLAMENASKNADGIITDLTLKYNHARQALITQGITEIVSGIPD